MALDPIPTPSAGTVSEAPKQAAFGGAPLSAGEEAGIEKGVIEKDQAEATARVRAPSSVDPEVEPTTNPRDLIPKDPYRTSPLFYEVAGYFGINETDYDGAVDQLSVIVDYAIVTGKSGKTEDVLVNLRKLENKLQPPAWGEKRFKNVYRYLRLASQHEAFKKAMSAYEREGPQ